MKKKLQKPENWQDFETLCKKLWGEIWAIPKKIKKNGRAGQKQHGVDIYGIPKNEKNYWGIQCKFKDSYANAKLTKAEINREIKKALKFKPQLDVFIFATTSNKDSLIEEYIRLKNLENKSFEILLYCWEDIEYLIEEHKDVYDYYMEYQKYKTKFDFSVYINEKDIQTYELSPAFYKTKIKTRIKPPETYNPRNNSFYDYILNTSINNKSTKNLSYCSFKLVLVNSGNRVLENWKINFKAEGDYKFLGNYNKSNKDTVFLPFNTLSHNTYKSYGSGVFSFSSKEPLIQKDYKVYTIWICPLPKEYEIILKWELLARDYNKSGKLILNISPNIQERTIIDEVENHYELRKEDIVRIDEKIEY